MNDTSFDTIDLMTKSELASELIGRAKKPALVIFEEDDTGHLRCFHTFFKEDTKRHQDIPGLLRTLARMFEGCEYHEGDDGTCERGQ